MYYLLIHLYFSTHPAPQVAVLQRILSMVEHGQEVPMHDLAVLLAVCKFIDLMALLPLESFHLYVGLWLWFICA